MQDNRCVADSDFAFLRQPPPRPQPLCPVCGRPCDTVLVARGSDLALGCEGCVARYDAWLWCLNDENRRD